MLLYLTNPLLPEMSSVSLIIHRMKSGSQKHVYTRASTTIEEPLQSLQGVCMDRNSNHESPPYEYFLARNLTAQAHTWNNCEQDCSPNHVYHPLQPHYRYWEEQREHYECRGTHREVYWSSQLWQYGSVAPSLEAPAPTGDRESCIVDASSAAPALGCLRCPFLTVLLMANQSSSLSSCHAWTT